MTITRIPAEASGDWHDKPLRWAVTGPGTEVQKFSTRKDARRYRSLRRTYDRRTATEKFVNG